MRSSQGSLNLLGSCALALLALWALPVNGQCPNPDSAICPPGFCMTEMSLEHEPATAGRPFVIAASGCTGSGPVRLTASQVVVDGSTVRIETRFFLGTWAMPDRWSETFLVPALDPGSYTLELMIWDEVAEEMVLNSTSTFQVEAAAVPALGRLGLLLLAGALAGAGSLLLLRRRLLL